MQNTSKTILARRLVALKLPDLEAKKLKELPVGVLRPGREVTQVLKRTSCDTGSCPEHTLHYCNVDDAASIS